MRFTVVSKLILLVLAVSGTGCDAFIWPEWGTCPSVGVEQDFDMESYLGTWYEVAGYNTALLEGDVRCARATYLPTERSDVIIVQNHGISQRTNKTTSINGTAQLIDPSTRQGRLMVKFPIKFGFSVKGIYQILKTDYETYSVVYSCKPFLYFWSYRAVFLLSRSQTFDSQEDKDASYSGAAQAMWGNKIDAFLTESDQTHCDV